MRITNFWFLSLFFLNNKKKIGKERKRKERKRSSQGKG